MKTAHWRLAVAVLPVLFALWLCPAGSRAEAGGAPISAEQLPAAIAAAAPGAKRDELNTPPGRAAPGRLCAWPSEVLAPVITQGISCAA